MPEIWGWNGHWGIFIPQPVLNLHQWIDVHWVPNDILPPWGNCRLIRLHTTTLRWYVAGPADGADLVWPVLPRDLVWRRPA